MVGDRLFILSQLLQQEQPILPGLVISDNLWRQFWQPIAVEITSLLGKNLRDLTNSKAVREAANRTTELILQQTFPAEWQRQIFEAAEQFNSSSSILTPIAVAPDGRHCPLDLWGSYTCNSNPEALSDCIKQVWSELFSANSLIYWHKQGISLDRVRVSILVRPLKSSYASGTVEVGAETMQIFANWGLAQSLVRGDSEPDRYDLERHTGCVLEQYVGQKSYAYRVKSAATIEPLSDLLEAYIPADDLASTFVLGSTTISELLESVLQVLERQPEITSLSWTAFRSPTTNQLHFYFTWLETCPSIVAIATAIEPKILEGQNLLLAGVGVAPGQISAEVIVAEDLEGYPSSILKGAILVTKAIDPQHIALLKHVTGIITEIGGKTSHGAIVARELNIPAIVNAAKATSILESGERVWLDGDTGKVYPASKYPAQLSHRRILTPNYPIASKLMVNLSQPESIATVARLPVDGVGLLRSELMLADLLASKTLAEWQESFRQQFLDTLKKSLRKFAVSFAPRPVFYRSLDRYDRGIDRVFGSRGAYGYQQDPTLFDLELEALYAVINEGYDNLRLILPFVRSVDEFKYCYRRLETIGLIDRDSFQVWIMAEVPSVTLLLPEYIRAGVRGIAIGTNDLTQLFLGVSREQTQFSDRGLNANHPAIQQAIAELIKTAKANNIGCCICGQAPVEHPESIDKFVEWGVDAISVEPEAFNRTYRAIARAEKRMLLERLRTEN